MKGCGKSYKPSWLNKTDKNTMKCKNCGKLRENHYKSTEKEKGGRWCYIFEDFPPENKKYYMQYENSSQSHGKVKK